MRERNKSTPSILRAKLFQLGVIPALRGKTRSTLKTAPRKRKEKKTATRSQRISCSFSALNN